MLAAWCCAEAAVFLVLFYQQRRAGLALDAALALAVPVAVFVRAAAGFSLGLPVAAFWSCRIFGGSSESCEFVKLTSMAICTECPWKAVSILGLLS